MPKTLLTKPEELYEAGPVICRQCGKPFDNLLIEEIKGVKKLRLGSMLVSEITGNCIHCGWEFEWRPDRRKNAEKIALAYGEVVALFQANALYGQGIKRTHFTEKEDEAT